MNAFGFMGSWYATYEDAPVWNNRKIQPPDDDPHGTDAALADFRLWFDDFAYEPGEPRPAEVQRSA